MSYKFFLSYTREKDKWGAVELFREHFQSELRRKIGDKEITVFMDVDIPPGTDWRDRLFSELDLSDCLIILVSPLWVKSEVCIEEYTRFRDRPGKQRIVLPILWDPLPKPERFNQSHLEILSELQKLELTDWTKIQYNGWTSPELQLILSALATKVEMLI